MESVGVGARCRPATVEPDARDGDRAGAVGIAVHVDRAGVVLDPHGAVDRDVAPLQADIAHAAVEKLIAGEDRAAVGGGIRPGGLREAAAGGHQSLRSHPGRRASERRWSGVRGWHGAREVDVAERDAARHPAGLRAGRALVADLEHVVHDHKTAAILCDGRPLERRGRGLNIHKLLVGPIHAVLVAPEGGIRHVGAWGGWPHGEAVELRRREPAIASGAVRGAERDVLHRDAREGRAFGLDGQ